MLVTINVNTNLKKPKKLNSTYLGGLVGLIIGLLLFWGSRYQLVMTSLFTLFGIGSIFILKRMQKQQYISNKLEEVIILFDNTSILMKAGLSLHEALSESRDLVSILKPAIERSLSYWPDTSAILENLRKEVDSPEGEVLISLLTQLNLVGNDKFEGVIQRETQRLQDVKSAAERVKNAKKPFWLVFARFIPALVIFGMFLGALYTRMLTTLPIDFF